MEPTERTSAAEATPQGLEQILQLLSRGAAQILSDIDHAAEQPIAALANVDTIAHSGAKQIRDKGSEYLSAANADVTLHEERRQRSSAFAGDVVQISDSHASTISDEVAVSLSAAQQFDLVRQKIRTLEQIAEYAVQVVAARGGEQMVDPEQLKRFYVSESQRKIHDELFGASEDAPQDQSDGADSIQLF